MTELAARPTAAGAPAPRRARLDRIEWLALLALTGLALVVLAMLLTKRRPLSGADGLLAADQLQYFAWIREAAHHGLIGNRFDLAPGPARSCTRASASPACCTRSGSPCRSPTWSGSRSRSR